jgi:hypothetical protein
MSEYQYFQFRKTSGTLSDQARKEVSKLSSRAQISGASASFTYDYGDFPADPIRILERHFDILVYLANWGSRRLAFRFPVSAVDFNTLRQFEFGEAIGIKRKGDYIIVDLFFDDEDFGDWGDVEGIMDGVLGLHEDLLGGDYRGLFLSWLHAAALEDGNELDVVLPPVPPDLQELSGTHQALIDFFGIDTDLVTASIPFGASLSAAPNGALLEALEKMPAVEMAGLLRRLLVGESPSLVVAELRKRLREKGGDPSDDALAATRVSAAVLIAQARQIGMDREREAIERKAKLELLRIEAIESDEERLWRRVDELIAHKVIKAYDEAVLILKDLLDLALHKNRRDEFGRRVKAIQARHPRLTGLRYRIQEAELL